MALLQHQLRISAIFVKSRLKKWLFSRLRGVNNLLELLYLLSLLSLQGRWPLGRGRCAGEARCIPVRILQFKLDWGVLKRELMAIGRHSSSGPREIWLKFQVKSSEVGTPKTVSVTSTFHRSSLSVQHLETWSPGWNPYYRIYVEILSIYRVIRKPHFSYSYISVYTSMSKNYYTPVGHSLWLFYDVWIRAQASPMTVHGMVESKMKKTVWKKNWGNSVYLRIYWHVLSI